MLFITDLEGDLEFRQNILKAGVDAFIVKPRDDIILVTQLKVMAKTKERNILISTQKILLETLVKDLTKELRNEIAERKTLEIKLKKSQDFFSSYIKKVPIGIFVINVLGQYVDANEMACQMMGRTSAEVLKISPADYLMHEELEKGLEGFRVLLEKNRLNLKLHVEKKIINIIGLIFWLQKLMTTVL